MACEPQLSRVFLGGLPSILKVGIRNDASGQWLENSIRYSVGHADASGPGGEAVLAKLAEVLFIETLRRYIALLPREHTGWLAGVRDRALREHRRSSVSIPSSASTKRTWPLPPHPLSHIQAAVEATISYDPVW